MSALRKDNRFLIVTGLSGSGKTVVSRFLEDMGYYCIDNLPAKLIPSFVDLWNKKKTEIDRVALIVDIREPAFLTEFPRIFRELRKKAGPKLIFLDSSDECLVNRFSESRRPHPLARNRSILEGVRLERRRMAEIKKMSDEVIDTSALNISQLKEVLLRGILKTRASRMQIVIVSFGYKFGIPLDSDLVLDVRFLPNPYYIDRLRNKTGRDSSVREYVLCAEETKVFFRELSDFLDRLVPRFVKEGKSHLTIALGCTGGKHRSVVIAEALKAHFRSLKPKVRIYHRDIYK